MADISRMNHLADYLASLRGRKWRPGVLDCGVFLADWVVQLGGPDPLADIRGTYSTERQFLRIIRRENGFEACCAARLSGAGLSETRILRSGVLMVVLAPYAQRRGRIQRRPTGAICVDETRRAVVTSDLGLVIAGPAELPTIRAFAYNG